MNQYKRVDILGVPIDKVDVNVLEKQLNKVLSKNNGIGKAIFIATVNASFVLKCQKNSDFMSILHSTDINTADGVSIQMAGEYLARCRKSNVVWFVRPFIYFYYGLKIGLIQNFRSKYSEIKDRVTGVYLARMLLALSNNKKYKVTIIHREDSLTSSAELLTKLKSFYPKLDIRVIPISLASYGKEIKDTIKTDIIFCTFGEYKQEKFLALNSSKLHCKIKVGIGGALDVIVGNVVIDEGRSKSGLEWFYRLLSNPKRVKKILISVFAFPFVVYRDSLR